MKPVRFRRRGLAIATAAIAAIATAGGIAYAAIPDSNKVFTACMLNGVGTMRLIDKSLPSTNLMSHCTDKETQISWNQAGQPGPAGPSGPQGPKGDTGTPGKDGMNGTNGTNGKDGVSVTNAVEPAGPNCANGGSEFAVGSGTPTYACNGKDGKDGANSSPAYAATTSQPVTLPSLGSASVVQLSLDPGSYVLMANAYATSLPSASLVGCQLVDTGTGQVLSQLAQGTTTTLPNAPLPETTTLGVVGAHQFATTTTVSVGCFAAGSQSSTTATGDLVAVKVSSIN
jgi:hypothetical protein